MSILDAIWRNICGAFKDTLSTSITLFKVMIPVLILVKICTEFGLIKYIAMPLEPIMLLVGLPVEIGLVWATGMLVGVYSSLALYASFVLIMPEPLSVAQVTVMATMILVAHGLPLEGQVSKQCGLNPVFQILLRIVAAIGLGFILHRIFAGFNLFTEPAVLLWESAPEPDGLHYWAWGQLKQLLMLSGVIFVLLLCMRILRALRIFDVLNFLLRPLLKVLDISDAASGMTVFGILLGLLYGSGLIIQEAQSGAVSHKDVFTSFSLMSLSHAIVEDTLLVLALGASMFGVFWGRLFFSLLVVALLSRIYGYFMVKRQTA